MAASPIAAARLVHGGQRHRQQARVFHIVDPDDACIVRNAAARGQQRRASVRRPCGRWRRQNRRRAGGRQAGGGTSAVVDPVHAMHGFCSSPVPAASTRFTKTGDTRLHGGRAARVGHHREPVAPPRRAGVRRPCSPRGGCRSPPGRGARDVDRAARSGPAEPAECARAPGFETISRFSARAPAPRSRSARRKLRPRAAPRIGAEFARPLFARNVLRRVVAPEQGVARSPRGGGDAAADGFENFGFAQVRDQQPEQHPARREIAQRERTFPNRRCGPPGRAAPVPA